MTIADMDLMMFTAPSLRHIEQTGPYLYDGKVAMLGEAVSLKAEYEIEKTQNAEQAAFIVTFLRILIGEIPAGYVREPKAPTSVADTPKPDMRE